MTKFPTVTMVLWLMGVAAGPAYAQQPVSTQEEDLSGTWFNLNHKDGLERGTGANPADLTGIPFNEEGRARATSYDIAHQWMLERQCVKWPPSFLVTGPFHLNIFREIDPATSKTAAWVVETTRDRAQLRIWMDGRPEPSPNAPASARGFGTGRWEGNKLVATFTHFLSSEIRRNGAVFSDRATLTLRLLPHGDLMTLLAILADPVYLSEPMVMSSTFRRQSLDPTEVGTLYTCLPSYEGAKGVAHRLPGQVNPALDELTKLYGVPGEAYLGGAETMYPEYRKKIKSEFVRPEWCLRYCAPRSQAGDGFGSGPSSPPQRPKAASEQAR